MLSVERIYWKNPTLFCCRLLWLQHPLHPSAITAPSLPLVFYSSYNLPMHYASWRKRGMELSQIRRQQKTWASSNIFPLRCSLNSKYVTGHLEEHLLRKRFGSFLFYQFPVFLYWALFFPCSYPHVTF
jgi:hypothetical protein